MLKGSATSEGTAAYRAAQGAGTANGHFREWRGLSISSLGIGTYLGPDDDTTDTLYEAAVERAIVSGINVVDSAINYRGQRSERAVGRALGRLVGAGGVARAAVVVATIDIYYLHNPETQLGEVSRPAFMRRLRAAFEFLESAARDRRIGLYGTSTWSGFRQPQAARDFLSLPDLVALAEEVGGPEHRFRVVQLPYNLAMPEAFTLPNQGAGRAVVPLLEAARQLGVYVMSSASIYQGQLAKNLPPLIARFLPGLGTDAQRALQFARSTPGVGTALVGMKTADHVAEAARLGAVSPVPWTEFKKLF